MMWYQGQDGLPCIYGYPISRYGIVEVYLPHDILGRGALPNVITGWYVLLDDMLFVDAISGSNPMAEIPGW